MRKITLSERPDNIQALRNGKTRFYYEITEKNETLVHRDEESGVETQTTNAVFVCGAVDLDDFTYENLIEALIRERYSVSDELAVLRQRDEKPVDFAGYNSYAEECKTIARSVFNL